MPYILKLNITPRSNTWPVTYFYEPILTEEWKIKMNTYMLKVISKHISNPLCIGVYLDNEIFWQFKNESWTQSLFEEIHQNILDATIPVIKKYSPHWIIFSNKYCYELPINTSWEWMNWDYIKNNVLARDINNGVDVICMNKYCANEVDILKNGEEFYNLEKSLSDIVGKKATVFHSEIGFQDNVYERRECKLNGVAGLYQRYTSADFPQVSDRMEKGVAYKEVIIRNVKYGGLGYTMTSLCDHGPVYEKWYEFWKKYKHYSSWGIYEPWRNILYTEILEQCKLAHEIAIDHIINETGLDMWRY